MHESHVHHGVPSRSVCTPIAPVAIHDFRTVRSELGSSCRLPAIAINVREVDTDFNVSLSFAHCRSRPPNAAPRSGGDEKKSCGCTHSQCYICLLGSVEKLANVDRFSILATAWVHNIGTKSTCHRTRQAYKRDTKTATWSSRL